MKINFRKIASVLATTVMLGSTVAFASAAWPTPFVNSGVSDAAVVYGSTAASTDMAAATQIADALGTKVTSTTGATVGGEGDKFLIGGTGSIKLNVGDSLTDVKGAAITKSELPTMLADGTFANKQNTEYKYTQKVNLGVLNFTDFSDSDYKNRAPALGIKVNSNAPILNYTLDFDTDPESTVTSGTDLTDFENKNIMLLGKNYYILDFKNGTSTTAKITLLDSASTSTVAEGETKTVMVGDKSYEVSIAFISDGQVILTVNGVNTEKMSDTGTTYGNTYKLADGTYVGVKTLNVQNYAGGTKNVEFSLGKGKLEVTNTNNVKINDKTIDDLYGYLTFGTSGAKATWQKMVIEWKPQERKFITPGTDLTMPGFEAIKFTMADTTMPAKELTEVDYGSTDYAVLRTTIKDGDVALPLVYITTSTGNITGIGKSATELLATSNISTGGLPVLTYNATAGTTEYTGFIASWDNTRDSESYFLKAKVQYNSDKNANVTTITNKLTGQDICTNMIVGDTCNVGSNIVLTLKTVTYTAGGEKMANFTGNSGASFNTLWTAKGLKVYLPFDSLGGNNSGTASSKGALNMSAAASLNKLVLWMSEADKTGLLAQKDFNVTIGPSTGTSTFKTTVSAIGGTWAGVSAPFETSSGSKLYEAYVNSDLASKVTHDQTNTDQYSATVEYHGGEVYGNVYVAAPSVTSSGASKVVSVKDTEIDSVKDKNLVVVGGSCINSVAAKLLGSDSPLCGSAFSDATTVGAGQYLIQVIASPYNAQKVAMLVAGYEAAETTAAAAKVVEGLTSTDVGTKVVGPTAA